MELGSRSWATVFAVGLVLTGGGMTHPDAAVAQTRRPIVVTRIYTASNGLAHAEETEMPRTTAGAHEMLSVTGAQFSSRPASTIPLTDQTLKGGPAR